MTYATQHLDEAARVLAGIDAAVIESMATLLAQLRSRSEERRVGKECCR